jgi:uncharacterized membrane protein YccC
MTATGATLAAGIAVAVLYVLFTAAGASAFAPAMFGGMAGMWAATMPSDATFAERRLTALAAAIPAFCAAALGAAVAPSFTLSIATLVVVVLLAVGAGGFGPRFATWGQIAFMSFYFALLMHFSFALLPEFAVAAAGGAISAFLFRYTFLQERAEFVLRHGLAAFRARLVLALDPLIDAVSAARWDPDISRSLRADMRQLHRCAAFLQGRLRVADAAVAGPNPSPGELRLLLFDTELAASNVAAAAQHVAGAGARISIPLRAELAGMLERAQSQLRQAPRAPAIATSPDKDEDRPPQAWPEQARRLHQAIRELLRTADAMQAVGTVDLAGSSEPARPVPAPEQQTRGPSQARTPLTETGRRAVQAAVATGLAVVAGAAIASGRQYWAALAAFLVLGGTETIEETFLKGLQRVAGTIIGAVAGFGATAITGPDPKIVLPLLGISVFAAMYLRTISYALMVFWTTMMLSLLYEFLGVLTSETLEVRVMETMIGAVIALATAALLLPIRTRQKLNTDAVAFVQTLDAIIQASLSRLATTADIGQLSSRALELDQQYRRLTASAEPLLRLPGALRLDGIERRLTAAAALTYYARQLVKAVEAIPPNAPLLDPQSCSELTTLSQDNLSALIQVLRDEPPGPVHQSEDLPFQTASLRDERSGAGGAAMHSLLRINETVLTLIEDLSEPPDSATASETGDSAFHDRSIDQP